MHRPVKILGYQRQFIHGNWKLYTDNTRDPNHGGLLHPFQVTFGIARLTQWGGAVLDSKGRHNISIVAEGTDSDADASKAYDGTGSSAFMTDYRLMDTSMLHYRKEYDDDITLSILSIFPNVVFQQIENSLATRQIRCKGVDAFELYWTYYGYEDDDQSMTDHRLRQANMAGPGGLISMEDGEAVEIVHRGIRRERDAHSVAEYGGRGEIKTQDTLITEVPLRGFLGELLPAHGHRAGSGGAMTAGDLRAAVDDLLAEYGYLIDCDRLEDWLELLSSRTAYTRSCRARITSGDCRSRSCCARTRTCFATGSSPCAAQTSTTSMLTGT